MSETNLKPCPFCGGRARYFDGASVGCSNRGCIGYGLPFVPAAEKMGRVKRERMLAEAWNRRAERTCRADLTEDRGEGHPWRTWECSACGGTFEDVYGPYDYCPRCGAKVVAG